MPCNPILFHNYIHYLSQCQVTELGLGLCPIIVGTLSPPINLICLGLCPIVSVRLSYIYGTGVVQRHPLLHTYAEAYYFLLSYCIVVFIIATISIISIIIVEVVVLIKFSLRLNIL